MPTILEMSDLLEPGRFTTIDLRNVHMRWYDATIERVFHMQNDCEARKGNLFLQSRELVDGELSYKTWCPQCTPDAALKNLSLLRRAALHDESTGDKRHFWRVYEDYRTSQPGTDPTTRGWLNLIGGDPEESRQYFRNQRELLLDGKEPTPGVMVCSDTSQSGPALAHVLTTDNYVNVHDMVIGVVPYEVGARYGYTMRCAAAKTQRWMSEEELRILGGLLGEPGCGLLNKDGLQDLVDCALLVSA